MSKNAWPETVIIWGAGATRPAGLLDTKDLANSINYILENWDSDNYNFLVLFPKNKIINPSLQDGFKKLIYALKNDKNLKNDYDFDALRYIAQSCPKTFDIIKGHRTSIDLQELFTLIDQLIDENLGLGVMIENKKDFLNTRRIVAARNCLMVLTEELQRIAVQGETPGKMSSAKFYHDLAGTLSDLMTKEAFEFESRGYSYISRSFYLYSYAMISFNWDPLIMWSLFNAHKDRNDNPPYMKGCLPLRLFSDLGTVIATRLVDGESEKISFSANEAQVIKINESDKYPSRIIRMGKLLFPHGIFGSRFCPQCGKMLMSFGHKWDKDSPLPFGPSLIKELQKDWLYNDDEKKVESGSIKCTFCGQMTYPYDMPLEMQTVIKKRAIAPIDEIKKEMGLLIKHAKHIVFVGYSLPKDDISEKLFFVSSLSGQSIKNKKCTVILLDEDYEKGANWLEGTDILKFLRDKTKLGTSNSDTIKNVLSIFDLSRTRITLKGIHKIFKTYSNMESAVLDIFYHGEFPPDRKIT